MNPDSKGAEGPATGQAAPDSLAKRYLFKVSTNVLGLIISLGSQVIIPRSLGPVAFGDFNFLTNFFNQFIGFFDLGTSLAFFTKLSQRPKDSGLIGFYLIFMGIMTLLTLGFVGLLHGFGLFPLLLPDQKPFFIILAAILGLAGWMGQVGAGMGDAFGLTVPMEKIRMVQKIVGFGLVVGLFFSNLLDLETFFYYNLILVFLFLAPLCSLLAKNGMAFRYCLRHAWRAFGKYLQEFWTYCHPLLVYSLASMIINMMDRWLLQRFAGSEQQGFFGLSASIGAICFLFSSAMTPLLTREFSIAFHRNDKPMMASLFRRHIPLLFSITAFFSCFVVVQAPNVVAIFGGSRFADAAVPVAIMAFYPVYQTYGQLVGAVFYATGNTGLYRNIGLTVMLLGMPATILLVGPSAVFGLDLGATGLALKSVLINFIAVNALLFFIARVLEFRYSKYLLHQAGCLALFLLVGHGCRLMANVLLPGASRGVLFVVAGAAYSVSALVILLTVPLAYGLDRGHTDKLRKLLAPYLGMHR
ncbi:MAG TPA: lipopolysaccharide biosynthesis protein [Candidatus Ozemobacteraceae bacterium]|nr:lipopolysaccharide biosynthesis protein [Candidatus Ozemobacteraceae bacterium]